MGKNNALISIIVPIYKVEEYLEQCVRSIFTQTYENLEIILVDDGSPDKCPEMCDKFALEDSRIKVIHKKNGGLSSARNAGLEIATGDYIGFVDSDDWVAPDMYEVLFRNISKDENIAFVSSQVTYVTDCELQPFSPDRWATSVEKCLNANQCLEYVVCDKFNICCWCKLYRSSVVSGIRFLEGRNNEDFLYNFYVAKQIFDTNYYIVEVKDFLYYYRYNNKGIKNNKEKPLELDSVKNSLQVLVDSKGISQLIETCAKCRFVSVASDAFCKVHDNPSWSNKYAKDLQNIIKQNRSGLKSVISNVGCRHKLMFYIIWYCPILWNVKSVRDFCVKKGTSIPCI